MKLKGILWVHGDALHDFITNAIANLGYAPCGRQPDFQAITGMFGMRLVYDTNPRDAVGMTDLARHDGLDERAPIIVQDMGWKVVFGIPFSVTLGIFPSRKDAFPKDTVFDVCLWCTRMLALEKEIARRKGQMIEIANALRVGSRFGSRTSKEVGTFLHMGSPIIVRQVFATFVGP